MSETRPPVVEFFFCLPAFRISQIRDCRARCHSRNDVSDTRSDRDSFAVGHLVSWQSPPKLPRSCRSRPPHRVSTLPRLRAVRPRLHRTRATNPRRLTVEPARSLAPPSRSHRLERDHRRPGEETPHAPFDTVPGTRCPASTRSRAWPRSRRVARVSRCARRPRPRPRPSRRSRSAAARRSRCATARFPSTPHLRVATPWRP